jgi:hypothetical protein
MRLYYSGAKQLNAIQTKPERSLGGFISSSQVVNGELNSLLADLSVVTQQDKTSQVICVFLRNELQTPVYNLYIGYALPVTEVLGIQIGLALVADSLNAYTELVPKPEALPLAVDFHDLRITNPLGTPDVDGSGFVLEEFIPGEVLAIWIRREAVKFTEYDYETELTLFQLNSYANTGDEPDPAAFELVISYDDQAPVAVPPPVIPVRPI